MKRILILSFLVICTTVNASKIYLYSNDIDEYIFITKNDNYNYGDYILEQNQILVIPIENGITSNDIITSTDYEIVLFENSNNSSIKDIEYNSTTGALTYTPNKNVVGEVSYRYYIKYDGKISNTSYIYFYVKNTISKYMINFYDIDDNKKIVPSITKTANVNKKIREYPIEIDGYNIVNNKPITKGISVDIKKNNYDFYYEKIPNTGI